MIAIDEEFRRARALSDNVWETLDGVDIPTSDRERIGAALINISMSHFSAIVKLMTMGSFPSAFALVRPSIDGFLRSQWVLFLATDGEMIDFLTGDSPPNWQKILSGLEVLGVYDNEFRDNLPGPLWALISDFVHGGGKIALKHVHEGGIGPKFSEDEIQAVLTLAKGWFLISASAIANLAKRDDLQQTLQSFAEEFAT